MPRGQRDSLWDVKNENRTGTGRCIDPGERVHGGVAGGRPSVPKKFQKFLQGVLVWIAAVLVKMSRDECRLPEWYLKRFGQTHSSRFGGVVP